MNPSYDNYEDDRQSGGAVVWLIGALVVLVVSAVMIFIELNTTA